MGLLCLALLLSMGSRASAGDDPLAEAQSLVEQGTRAVEVGSEKEDEARIRAGLALYRRALGLFREALEQEALGTAEKTRIGAYVADVESRIRWYEEILDPDDGAVPTIEVPARKRGESASAWGRRVHALYGTTEAPVDRAVLARALAAEAGAHALPTLYVLFETESAPKARAAVHAALAHVGTPRVAKKMGSYARKQGRAHWAAALDVICRCLAKPEEDDAEAPFLRAVRRFHTLKDRALTLQILDRLDALGSAGTAAIGEVLYVPDFGVHAQAIEALAARRNRRAAPPADPRDGGRRVRREGPHPGARGTARTRLVRRAGIGRARRRQRHGRLASLDAARDHRQGPGHGQVGVAHLVEGREVAPSGGLRGPRTARPQGRVSRPNGSRRQVAAALRYPGTLPP